jgi:hypothetical protein
MPQLRAIQLWHVQVWLIDYNLVELLVVKLSRVEKNPHTPERLSQYVNLSKRSSLRRHSLGEYQPLVNVCLDTRGLFRCNRFSAAMIGNTMMLLRQC